MNWEKEIMKSQFNRLISAIVFVLCMLASSAWANDLLIYYSSNESSQYSNLKSHYEDLGFTVTGSTSTTVSSSDLLGKELVIDIAGNSNCGSTCRTNYESYIGSGGKLIIAAENGATNRLANIESLIESKLSVGAFDYYTTYCNDCYSSNRKGDYASGTSSENVLPAVDTVIRVTDSSGTVVADNYSDQSTNYWSTWHQWDYGSNGGTVTVTFGYGQFLSTVSNATNMDAMLTSMAEEEGLYSSTPTVTITSTQTTAVNTAKGTSDNGVDLNVNGDNNTLDIQQAGEDNFITGSDWSSTGTITGTDNTLNVDQGNITTSGSSGRNGIGLDITGNSNTLNLSQGDYSVDVGDHRMHLDIDGSTNTLNLSQRNDGDTNSEHYMSLDLDSSQNVISMQQLNDGDKFLFLDVDNNNNTVDVNQSGDGSHYMDIKLGTGSYAHDVDISQTGDGNHAGRVDLDGYATDFDLLQQGSTSQSYSLDMTCGTANGCTVSTTQGN